MKSTLLLDHDLEGFEVFLQAGLRETGWDQIFSLEFKRLREYRQRVANRLAAILLYPDEYLGAGRVFVP
jgi:hypothetical protein